MPKVSVVIPIYNVEKYIARCAKALLEQTLDDIEYVFVNDCTPDNSMDILKSVIEEYPQRKKDVRITSTPQNSGLPTARKTGILLTTGEYIIHCDSDDWPEPSMYEKLYNKAKKGDYDIVYCDFFMSTNHSKTIVKKDKESWLMNGPIWNRLVKGSICRDNYIIYPMANKTEDGALIMQYCYYSKSRAYVAEPLYNYFVNEESMTRIKTKEAYIKNLKEEIQNTDLRIDFLRRHNAEEKFVKNIYLWKYTCRSNLLPIIAESYQLWRDTYPELDRHYQICKYLRFRSIVKYLMIRWRLYK